MEITGRSLLNLGTRWLRPVGQISRRNPDEPISKHSGAGFSSSHVFQPLPRVSAPGHPLWLYPLAATWRSLGLPVSLGTS